MQTNNRLSVLLIEDNEADCLRVRSLLSDALFTTFSVDWVQSYEAGLEAARRPGHDVYLLAYPLGGRTGMELLSEVNSRGCDAPVIVLAGAGGTGGYFPALQAGAADWLPKDAISADALERSIRFAVGRKQAERELKGQRDSLARIVEQKTAELEQANQRLAGTSHESESAAFARKGYEEVCGDLGERSRDIVLTMSTDGIILSVNPAFERTIGWAAGEWTGRNISGLIHRDDLKPLMDRLARVLGGERLVPVEVRAHCRSGTWKVLGFRSAFSNREDPSLLTCTAHAIHDAGEASTRPSGFLQSVLESLPYPCYVLDAEDFSILMHNSAAAPENLPRGIKCHALFHNSTTPCTGQDHECPFEEIRLSKKAIVTRHVHVHEGEARHVEIRGYPVLDEHGAVSLIIEYCLDVTDKEAMEENLAKAREELERRVELRTAELASANAALQKEIAERRRMEEALRFDEKRLEALLQLSQMTLTSEMEIAEYVLEQDVRLTRSKIGSIGFLDEDEKVFTLRAWSREVKQQCATLQTPAHFEIENSGIWADAVRSHSPVIVNEYARATSGHEGLPFGHIPLERFMSIPVMDGSRIAALAIVANKEVDYDQSDVRQLTLLMDGMWKLIERNRSFKVLKESENLAGIGSALSGVAHDIKTPLIAIGGFARMVQSHLGKGHRDWGKMEIILNETTRLEKMVKDMLDFSKPLTLDASDEEMTALIDECFELTGPLAQAKSIELRSIVSTRLPPVHLDRSRMKQVLLNLLTNAIQASPEGETVAVRSRIKGSDLVVEVIDAGCGIPAVLRKNVFSPFFTTKKEGTGLGLSIVRKIVEAHRGRVDILDNAGNGITFRIILPIS